MATTIIWVASARRSAGGRRGYEPVVAGNFVGLSQASISQFECGKE
jgi:hypothetical protein